MNLRNQIGLWEVLNPSIYLVSLAPLFAVLLQVGMADSALPALLLATAGVVALQHAVNIFNDLSDDRRGADVEKHVSWVRFHRNRTRILLHAGLSVLCGVALGLAALWIADRIILLALAAPLVAVGFLYNWGTRPLGYTAASELVTALAYGPGVFGCLLLVAESHPQTLPFLAGCIACAALAVSVLLAHQPAQVLTDGLAGKRTFAVRHGARAARLTARWLLVLAAAAFILPAPAERSVLAAGLLLTLWLTRQRHLQPGRILMGTCSALSIALLLETTS